MERKWIVQSYKPHRLAIQEEEERNSPHQTLTKLSPNQNKSLSMYMCLTLLQQKPTYIVSWNKRKKISAGKKQGIDRSTPVVDRSRVKIVEKIQRLDRSILKIDRSIKQGSLLFPLFWHAFHLRSIGRNFVIRTRNHAPFMATRS